MSEQQIPDQAPEPGWPVWADTPAKRERNRQHWARHNERIRAAEASIPVNTITITVTWSTR
jgi:hypothetical protein